MSELFNLEISLKPDSIVPVAVYNGVASEFSNLIGSYVVAKDGEMKNGYNPSLKSQKGNVTVHWQIPPNVLIANAILTDNHLEDKTGLLDQLPGVKQDWLEFDIERAISATVEDSWSLASPSTGLPTIYLNSGDAIIDSNGSLYHESAYHTRTFDLTKQFIRGALRRDIAGRVQRRLQRRELESLLKVAPAYEIMLGHHLNFRW